MPETSAVTGATRTEVNEENNRGSAYGSTRTVATAPNALQRHVRGAQQAAVGWVGGWVGARARADAGIVCTVHACHAVAAHSACKPLQMSHATPCCTGPLCSLHAVEVFTE